MHRIGLTNTGNICRSPIAEAVFVHTVNKTSQSDIWTIDSAAIGSWHVGKKPDSRALATMRKHDLPYSNTAQQVRKEHFQQFDYIFGMDEENINDLKRMMPKSGATAKVLMLGDFDPENDRIIRDPYYDDGSAGFEKCYQQCVRCCEAFLDKVNKNEI